ncbi:MAG: cysteine synthase family protein [Ignavibacteria bacterium]|nr:cysteine synthase family protein [Ignavibacteria bacterium]
MKNYYNNISDLIGNTPMLKLSRIAKGLKADIYAKIEYMNPGGSVKDRIAKYMVEKAEREGKIKPGDTILENSSGNTATGLSIVCNEKGYKLKLVVRDTMSTEKRRMLEILGAEIITADTSLPPENPNSYNKLAENIAKNDKSVYYLDQHNNLDNNEAHYMTTGPEIWEQLEGKIDYFIGGIGTGGTVTGAGKFLKEKNPDIKVIGVDPFGSVFYDYFKEKKIIKPYEYKIEGLGDEFLIGTAQLHLLDDMMQVKDSDSIEWAKKIAAEEGLIAGGSSGANVWAAVKLAKEIDREANIVTLVCDSGYKYISTIFDDDWAKKNIK